MAEVDTLINPRAVTGDNKPPLTPFETMQTHINDLFDEAKGFLDGEPATTQEQADAIDLIKALALEAEKAGEDLRKAEAKPFDDGKKEVQERWNPLVHKDTGKCRLIIQTCGKALTPFLIAKQAKIDAEAAEQRRIADLALAEAQNARVAAADNLSDREAAEEAITAATEADRMATKAEGSRAQAKGGTRATSLRSVWTPELVKPTEALKHYMAAQPDALKEWLNDQARADIRAGKREIPGFTITETKVAQ